ncbi:MAG: hypothetical protein HQ523_05915 [Lentisphaerae bacterium]|nr:hypothetical protein [Lentisphaerota bacterium]
MHKFITLCLLVSAVMLASSCDESTDNVVPPPMPDASANYHVTFEGIWSAATHDNFPPVPHLSGLVGGTHTAAAVIWAEGALASIGIKDVAERGARNSLQNEFNVLGTAGSACSVILADGINPSPGSSMFTFTATLDCPLVTIVSMIAPSPDWFVGVAGLNLMEDGDWVESLVVTLDGYDAGTDSGASHNAADFPTVPPEPIAPIGWLAGVGTFTFTRL